MTSQRVSTDILLFLKFARIEENYWFFEDVYYAVALFLFGPSLRLPVEEWNRLDVLVVVDDIPNLGDNSEVTVFYYRSPKKVTISYTLVPRQDFLRNIHYWSIERDALLNGIAFIDENNLVETGKKVLDEMAQSALNAGVRTIEEQRRRIGRVDLTQMKLISRTPPKARFRPMLHLRNYAIQVWKRGLATKYPETDALECCQLFFDQIR